MKIRLLVGSVLGLLALAITLPVQTATITINDSSCASFSTSGSGSALTITCGGPVVTTTPPTCTGLTANPATIINGGSSTLTANCPGADTFVWTPSASNSSSIIVSPATTSLYSVLASNAQGPATGGAISTTVTVNQPSAAPVCSIVASDTSITAGQSTTLDAVCSEAASYAWTATTGAAPNPTKIVTVSPTVDTTYAVIASNSEGPSVEKTIDIIVAAAPVQATFDCKRSTIKSANVQTMYKKAGEKFLAPMSPGQAYTMSFTTGSASAQKQSASIVEAGGGQVKRFVTIAEDACNFISPDVKALSTRPLLKFSVGIPVQIGIFPGNNYPVLKPNTKYWVNYKNSDATSNDSETCITNCAFALQFFNTIP